MSPQTIVIAGGSGFLGVSLAYHLADAGKAVVILSRHPPKPHGPWRHVGWDARTPELALYGRYVVSQRLEDEGFEFGFPTLPEALKDLIDGGTARKRSQHKREPAMAL
jgi:NAD dependent epimerase/dehydratase family enzyme